MEIIFTQIDAFFTSNFFDLFFKVFNVIAWAVAIFLLSRAKVRKKTLEKRAEIENEKMLENQQKQKEIENKMAKFYFLCDRCGQEVAANDGKKYGNFDVCGVCYDKLIERDKKIAEAKAELAEAETRVIEAKAKFNKILTEYDDCKEKTKTEDPKEESKEETENTLSVLEKLGIKN